VHEYGGAACTTGSDGSLIFSDSTTNGAFRLRSKNDIEAIVNPSQDLRYGDFDVHPIETNLIIAIQEDHTCEAVENRLVLINSTEKSVKVIVQGADFYIYPRFNHDGTKICWIQWNHPDMSWTGSELYVGEWNGKEVKNSKLIAGKPRTESTSQPRWHEDGTLFFATDRTGFSQLFRLDVNFDQARQIVLDGFEDADVATKKTLLGV
jgi:Tol biopolymer transport system component